MLGPIEFVETGSLRYADVLYFFTDASIVFLQCFMEPLKKVQVEGHLMFAEPDDLFGNLDELCYVSQMRQH